MRPHKHIARVLSRPHKYIARVLSGKGYRYFYDADEYNAYKYGGSHGHRDYPGRPHQRNAKIEVDQDIFGREKPVTVKKGKPVGKFYGINLTSDNFGINFKKPKPIGGPKPQSVTNDLKAYGDKDRAEREKLHDLLDKDVERKQQRHADAVASAKKKQEASKKRVEKLDKTAKKINDAVDADTMSDIVSFVQGDPLPFFRRMRKKKKKKQAAKKPNYYPNEKASREALEASQASLMRVLNEAKKKHK